MDVTKSTMRAAFAHASLEIKDDMGLIGGTSGERGQAQESTQGVIYKSQARGEGDAPDDLFSAIWSR
jgi:hypothetical protein